MERRNPALCERCLGQRLHNGRRQTGPRLTTLTKTQTHRHTDTQTHRHKDTHMRINTDKGRHYIEKDMVVIVCIFGMSELSVFG